ncbi:MAG: rhodanese-like domain-containing protein [Meiothermus sp.]|uniref:rhodanese-like domain-containing protein n=1 Tax=Meiothermus sp. TaxID=1955249 RepID=UPI0025F04D8A|nr:rhodanese-like domain-containing protein [Meiothermus sp.]MCS7058090.1 rhodanese-like domain-containing protein [Meiothermus sp.]MCS7194055.1 rhodanese-like domain-containing protein [Meiothermus sp.]MCX7740426.1 rhodanese-like domain-containing protein [Meiothermus sp.]MDW8091169.1 rhodanese-like domain-containing protein [Meiothermus sp.]MDW8480453.1 rhodanese-like domain-containing protein [Meiothermus sp.]
MRRGMLVLVLLGGLGLAQEMTPGALLQFGSYLKKVNPASYLLYAAEAKDYVEVFEPFILDVRTNEERARGFIPGSVHIHISQLPDRLAALPKDKSKPILVYCGTGHVSAVAAAYLRALGYTEVKNLNGGFRAWLELGLPVERP